MGFLRVIFIQVLIFAAMSVFAEEHGHAKHHQDDRFFNLNFHPELPGNMSFGNLLSNLFPFFRASEVDGPHGEGPHGEGPHNASDEQHDRFFFHFPTFSTCNYTTAPGATCSSCTQAVTCLPSNVALVRQCRGLFRYCNNGYCSLFQGAACNGTTTG